MKISVVSHILFLLFFSLTAMERNSSYVELIKCSLISNAQRAIIPQAIYNSKKLKVAHALYESQEQRFFKKVLYDPCQALEDIRVVYERYKKNVIIVRTQTESIAEAIQKNIKNFEKECPAFLLNECELHKFYRSKDRIAFENNAICALSKRLSEQEVARYVRYAGAGLFQDLVILTKALYKKPNAHIEVHLIDIQFKDCVTVLHDLLGYTREICPERAVDMNTLIDRLKLVNPTCDYSVENQRAIELSCAQMELATQQFVRYVKKIFPFAHIAVTVHDTVTSYCDYITRNNISYPDVIVASDIQNQNSVGDYYRLCRNTLRAKPHAHNVLLSKEYDKALLNTLYLDHNGKPCIVCNEIK
ncbi:MAG: hypothetical protein WC707_02525 [Candidatus Babeliaceae bacterium]|jgi:hypothetical protein